MAVYATGTINSATPSVDLMTALQTQMLANGWTSVETYTNGTNVTDIYKSPGAGNSFGTDFYVGINRTSTTSSVRFILAEQWDSVNKKFIKYAPMTGSNTIPNPIDWSVNDATGLLPNSATLIGSSSYGLTVVTSSLFTWYSNITIDRVLASTSAGYITYVGLFDPLVVGDTFPIANLLLGLSSGAATSNLGGVTRELFQTATNAQNFNVQLNSNANEALLYGASSGITSSTIVDVYTGKVPVLRVKFVCSRSTYSPRGLLKGIVWSYGGALYDDTMSYTLGATTYNFVRGYSGAAAGITASLWFPKQ